ncbi:hypothetical protein DVH24_018879 [Malus domestica]|uniref:Ubiquitin-fold modifier-conjugating enzyme 1 n=1 Tax=Malus domestica TaxID=3750 RepID=A0A498HMN5_MALDO|nr:hypothetical protein DVH24_018879 [Malus domestica]
MIVVRSMFEKDGFAKGIVFSQFTSFLDISRFEYTQMNKSNDNDWFRISAANPKGTRWTGKCWYVYTSSSTSSISSSISPSPTPPPHLNSSSLTRRQDPKGRPYFDFTIFPLPPFLFSDCNLSPLISGPRFGMAHALCLGLAPWLAAFMLIRIAHDFSFLYEVYEKRIVAEAGCFTVS